MPFRWRFKQEMWAKVAEEMAIPWRAAEAMHWQIGEADMAKRAGVTPFCLSAVNVEGQAGNGRATSSRGHHHSHSLSQSQGAVFARDVMGPINTTGPRGSMPPGPALPPLPQSHSRSGGSRRDSYPQQLQYTPPSSAHREDRYSFAVPQPPPPPPSMQMHGGSLPPIQTHATSRTSAALPSVSELTTGVSPYSTPAYSVGVPSVSPAHSGTASPNPFMAGPPPHPHHQLQSTLPPPHQSEMYTSAPSRVTKRSRSPDFIMPEPAPSRRRHYHSYHGEHDDKSTVPRHMP